MNRSIRTRGGVWIGVAAAALCLACSRSPQTAFARTIDRAASWAASARFAEERARAGEVPGGYVSDVTATGAEDVRSLASRAASADGVDPSLRSDGVAACEALASTFAAAQRGHATPPVEQLQQLEARLRAVSARARSAR